MTAKRSGAAMLIALCLAGAATMAAAQDAEPVFSPALTEDCLAESLAAGFDPAECIGRAAEACMNGSDIGGSTVGMNLCIGAELGWWDTRLNAAYRVLMAQNEATDAEMAELGTSAPKMAPALRDMQRAWIAFRDAACAYEVTWWGGGTGGGPAWNGCMMDLTARQTLRLEAGMER
ncbi:DUF1311 domain-containing protein [Aliigemmobacter aestuarii]|uniref:DUF1311 domain-containing protein n=1 Tax=Aliigemmobacter aestuarii TaxID=1445661 RepID=A0A4S3MKT8_9RHOB|nr:lysozyme inhibitor LprI family protein [Gemmobacter aestuarii]THD82818.1 DUF1311 domain-containing protein [Gemmobacter aestuarii]